MKISLVRKACIIAGFLVLAGCQGTPQTDQLNAEALSRLPPSARIQNVPFYPQQAFYCGPTTLAEVFGFYGQEVSADDIAPKLFIPGKEGSLQLEMVSATRGYGFLPYTDKGTLSDVMQLVSDQIPVIVFQNLSVQWLPQWHYAVVTGFDKQQQEFIVHTGVTPSHHMSFSLFERTWGRAGYWFLAPLTPQRQSQALVPYIYIKAAYDMLKVGDSKQAEAFLAAATRQWPGQWLSYFLLANHLAGSDIQAAVHWYEQGYRAGQHQPAYLNNYALALEQSGQPQQARQMLTEALSRFPDDTHLQDTKEQLFGIK